MVHLSCLEDPHRHAMNEDQTIKTLETTLARLLTWISAAEARISLVLGLDTAMMGALAVFAPSPKLWTVAASSFGAIAVASLALSLICLAFATFPRTDGPKRSLIYFGGIVSRDSDQFLSEMRALSVGQYIEDLSRQCYRNAEIATTKFSWVKRAQIALFLAIAPWGIALFLLYQLRP